MHTQPHLQLLESAVKQYGDGDYREAVVLSHIAIEVVADQVLAAWIDIAQPVSLRPWLKKQIENNHNLGTTKASKLYEALSGDMISEQSFWKDFLTANQLRNDVMHEGREVSQAQARAALANAKLVIGHLLSHQPS
ncbi:hypothetical protein IT415_02405 [bacterium]|nr:hypothetical protein [bacterium]